MERREYARELHPVSGTGESARRADWPAQNHAGKPARASGGQHRNCGCGRGDAEQRCHHVEVDDPVLSAAKLIAENDVQKYEFRALINAYLASIPNAPAKSLADIIAAGKFHKPSLESFLTSAQAYQGGIEELDYGLRLLRNARTRDRLISLLA